MKYIHYNCTNHNINIHNNNTNNYNIKNSTNIVCCSDYLFLWIKTDNNPLENRNIIMWGHNSHIIYIYVLITYWCLPTSISIVSREIRSHQQQEAEAHITSTGDANQLSDAPHACLPSLQPPHHSHALSHTNTR